MKKFILDLFDYPVVRVTRETHWPDGTVVTVKKVVRRWKQTIAWALLWSFFYGVLILFITR